jgi:hypothetical protein
MSVSLKEASGFSGATGTRDLLSTLADPVTIRKPNWKDFRYIYLRTRPE